VADINDALAAYNAKDYATARRICADLAEQGDAHARYMLGMMISFGEGGPSDPEEAVKHYRIAADAGHHVAQYCLGAMYAQGRGVPKDFAEALRWYRLSAEGGDPDALFKVGVMYANGEGVPKDGVEAGRWWDRAAAAGNKPALLFLGHLAAGYFNTPVDDGRAGDWYLRAWQAGDQQLTSDAVASIRKIAARLERAADAGSVLAQHALGVYLKYAVRDHAAAARRLIQAADQDHPAALRLLGFSYQRGEGVPEDLSRAAQLYQRAADLGDRFAMFNLACFYRDGVGLPADVDLSIRWFRRAANHGMNQALLPLAEQLARRNRNRADANEAVQRLMMAAQIAAPDAELHIFAGDGSWSATATQNGSISALRGVNLDELTGLPDDYEGPPQSPDIA
jgi:TPR repeat protein